MVTPEIHCLSKATCHPDRPHANASHESDHRIRREVEAIGGGFTFDDLVRALARDDVNPNHIASWIRSAIEDGHLTDAGARRHAASGLIGVRQYVFQF